MKKINIVALVGLLAFVLSCMSGQTPPTPPAPPVDTATAVDVTDPAVTDTPVMPDQQVALRRALTEMRPRSPVLDDTRSHDQIAAAACTGPGGQWRCKGVRPMASSGQPIIPASWTVPAWFIDPANSSGTASDSNDCVTSSTPCLTYQEIGTHRWGTYSPRLRQSTTLTFLSSHSDNTDPVYLTPYVENSAVVKITGTRTSVQTGTLASTVVKNRSTGQLLNVTLGAGLAVGQLIVNTTHASTALLYKNTAGNAWSVSQPLTNATTPASFPSEVNTWANTDAYTVFSLTSVNLVEFDPLYDDVNAAFNSNPIVSNLLVLDPNVGGNGSDPIFLGGSVAAQEMRSQRYIACGGFKLTTALTPFFSNVSVEGGATYVPTESVGVEFVGGQILNTPLTISDWTNTFFQADAILGINTAVTVSFTSYNTVFVDTGKKLSYIGGGTVSEINSPAIWGAGSLDVGGTVHLQYPNGGTGAASTFLQSGGFTINGLTTAYSIGTGAGSAWNGGITVSAANLDAAFGVAGFGSRAVVPGGASVANLTNGGST